MAYGGDIVANELITSLMAGESFDIPDIDFSDDVYQIPGDKNSELYKEVVRLTNADLTEGKVGGKGTFDALMCSFSAHLLKEYEKGRITGAEYTKAYIALSESAMGGAVQYLLGRDQAFWGAVQAQAASITARVQLQTAKVQYAQVKLEALTARANYALTKLKLATEDTQYGQGKFAIDNILPQQKLLLVEQTESARAQTLNNRTDGAAIVGVLGKQKDLYSQQITSYQRDSEVKAAKPFVDAWITMKTMDDGLLPPPGFENTSLNQILSTLKTNNGFQ